MLNETREVAPRAGQDDKLYENEEQKNVHDIDRTKAATQAPSRKMESTKSTARTSRSGKKRRQKQKKNMEAKGSNCVEQDARGGTLRKRAEPR